MTTIKESILPESSFLIPTQKNLLTLPVLIGQKVLPNASLATSTPPYPIRTIFQSNSKRDPESWSPSNGGGGIPADLHISSTTESHTSLDSPQMNCLGMCQTTYFLV